MSFELLALCPPLSKCWDYRQVHTTTQRLYVCMCVCCAVCVYVFVSVLCVCWYKCRGQRRTPSFLIFHILPYSFEESYLLEPGAHGFLLCWHPGSPSDYFCLHGVGLRSKCKIVHGLVGGCWVLNSRSLHFLSFSSSSSLF